MTIWRMRIARRITKAKNTHKLRICNTYCSSTGTVVTRTRLVFCFTYIDFVAPAAQLIKDAASFEGRSNCSISTVAPVASSVGALYQKLYMQSTSAPEDGQICRPKHVGAELKRLINEKVVVSNLVYNSAYYIYFSSLNVSGRHVPIMRRNYCIYATVVFVTLYGWLLVCWLDWNQSNQQTRRHPYRVTNTSVA